jgi:hypothetical protein
MKMACILQCRWGKACSKKARWNYDVEEKEMGAF